MSTTLVIFTAILGVLLTVAGTGGVWLAIKTGQSGQTVKNFQDAAASWREKADALSSDLDSVRAELKILHRQHDKLQSEHEALKNVVIGKSALEALGVQVNEARTQIILEVRLNREILSSLEHLTTGGTDDQS